jgi:hypothetical protein
MSEVSTPCLYSTDHVASPPDKALPRPPGSFSNKDHTPYQYFLTLHLLETIKGACRDRSKGTMGDENKTNTRTKTLLDLARAPVESLTYTLHSHLETWEPLPLSPACNPYYKHFDAR